MSNPILSIVVATYGRFDYFKRLVESCRVFPPGSYEIIAVSSDVPGDKLAWMGQQPDVTTLFAGQRLPGQHRSQSLYAFENIGIKAAKGEWVFVTNDDTQLDPMFMYHLNVYGPGYDVIMVKGHLGDVGLGARTAVIGSITPPPGIGLPGKKELYLYDFTLIRKSVYEQIGYLDEGLDWFGKGFDLAMACETQQSLRIFYQSPIAVNHDIAAENRRPPHYARDFHYATQKWTRWCVANGWQFEWPW